ncbi:Para-hydroxybenzoate-polyprenyltransferase,mitochondrial [Wickerhamomyces ciferrii]|uniref:4-hydroxybenzoate polyprenyltransferase, mitochondrial n=1 Tax=Wickerhamomyces ciferrii (strain ATCC 14091 / BCRC 22168 / CBS 111 / JCM 3599 / NBRC 0793 / NRRL Y-1031 F-60-10) TaxID=1206466 RepID=K0KJR1_WICCF|nr:Para-hydroxybenzoate-polyprenyltransferase,mitochondrial [Wickerhamomyces ciferrii]CCH42377.1 Para-hydroxybenzoate-polyprenyltransferase,mitochondrial [Wickerhamomyces ciferrii]
MIRFIPLLHRQIRFPITNSSSHNTLFKRLIQSSSKQLTTVQSTPQVQSQSAILAERFTPEERALASKQRLQGLGPLVSRLPESWIPYAELSRLEKPVGTWLLYVPCTWSIIIAATQTGAPFVSTMSMLAIFGTGALIMRGFGCTINDLLDKNYDDKVLRTIERPIASGRVTRKQAVAYAGGQLALGLGVILMIPLDCFVLGAASLLPVCTYPLFKRFTYYPQAVLSLTFNWGALLGFPAMGLWDINTMCALFASTFCWTMIYDTIYAHQDKKFDINAGVKSTALKWGTHSKKIFSGLSLAQLSLLGYAGYSAGILLNPGFLIGSGIFSYRLIKMIKDVNLDDPRDCWKHFTSNINSGLIFSAGLLFDYILMCLGLL